MIRIKFVEGKQKDYLAKVEKMSYLSTDELAKMVGIVGRTFRDWKREKLCMSLKAAKVFNKKFGMKLPDSEVEMIERWRKMREIGLRRGGLNYIKKYGNPATLEGRKKGGLKVLDILRQTGKIPKAKSFLTPDGRSKKLAEFVGIMLGDGSLGESNWSITLNSIEDKQYAKFVVLLVKELFGFIPGVAKRKNANAMVISGSGLKSVKYFRSIGLISGNKVKNQVGVPGWIWENREFSRACLRGLMDTDGGVFKHTYPVNGKKYSYLKLCFSNRSLPLLKFVRDNFKKEQLIPKMVLNDKNKQVWLYNCGEVVDYLRIVGTHNLRLLKNLEESHRGLVRGFAKPLSRKVRVGSNPTSSATNYLI